MINIPHDGSQGFIISSLTMGVLTMRLLTWKNVLATVVAVIALNVIVLGFQGMLGILFDGTVIAELLVAKEN